MAKSFLVGMSGGVDSAVTALLLKQQGYEVEGMFMKNWDYGVAGSNCPAAKELEDVMEIGVKLGIQIHARNFVKEYKQKVFDYFIKEYASGRTPNPDVLCNKYIKFNLFKEEAELLCLDSVATGHYAEIIKTAQGQYQLHRPKDKNKDQTYFLYALNQQQLSYSHFPLANYTKPQVREIAAAAGLHVSNKKDSTGICFIGEQNFNDFISQYIPSTKGEIVNEAGAVLGEHKGLIFYTIGQRKGIGLGMDANNPDQAWYVAAKNSAKNQLLVVKDKQHPLLASSKIIIENPSWINGKAPEIGTKFQAQIRHRERAKDCILLEVDKDVATIEFLDYANSAACGQHLVLYDQDCCLGGGVIIDKF